MMKKTINRHKQNGLTLISTIVVIVFLLFQVVIAMNVIPTYITDATVKRVMAALPADLDAREASLKELEALVIRRLSINSVYSINREHISVKKNRDEKIVTIEYEPRGKLIGNLEFIVNFKHEAVISSR